MILNWINNYIFFCISLINLKFTGFGIDQVLRLRIFKFFFYTISFYFFNFQTWLSYWINKFYYMWLESAYITFVHATI